MKQPIVLESKDGILNVGLEINYRSGTIGKDPVCLRSYKLISYNGIFAENTQGFPNLDSEETLKFVGPTLKVNPGDQLNIRIKNNLPLRSPDKLCLNINPTSRLTPQDKDFNITNLHTHGLEVSPEGNSDNVFVAIPPKNHPLHKEDNVFTYSYKIPTDHAPGTFWYHPHFHGSTAVQVSSGMEGALIVKGGLDDVLEIKEAKDVIFVLQQIPFDKVNGTVEVFNDSFGPNKWANLKRRTSINSQDFPKITLNKGEVQRWRFIHGGVREPLDLRIVSKKNLEDSPYYAAVNTDEAVDMHEIAVDGLSLDEMKDKQEIILEPGYRSDVLVQVNKSGTYYLVDKPLDKPLTTEISQPNSGDAQTFKDSERTNLLAEVEVKNDEKKMSLPIKDLASLVKRPFANITDNELKGKTASKGRTVEFDIDCRTNPCQFLADGQEYHPNQPDRVLNLPIGTVEELTLVSKFANHPFHIHVNPFEVINDGNGNNKGWKDTIMVEQNKPVTIRMRYSPKYPGKTVYHCHILDHEDQGMMREIKFTKDVSFKFVDNSGSSSGHCLSLGRYGELVTDCSKDYQDYYQVIGSWDNDEELKSAVYLRNQATQDLRIGAIHFIKNDQGNVEVKSHLLPPGLIYEKIDVKDEKTGKKTENSLFLFTWNYPTVGKNYSLTNKKSGNVLGVVDNSTDNGASIQEYTNKEALKQKWQMQSAGSNYYFLVNKNSNKVVAIDVNGAYGSSKDKAVQYANTNANDQKWKLEDAGDGYFYLVNKSSDKVLGVLNDSTVDNGSVQREDIKKNPDNDAQKWKFDAVN